MTYIYTRGEWPDFEWQDDVLAASLAQVRHRQGRLIGRMEALGFRLREEAVLRTLTDDVIKSSDIEGEKLDEDQVRSSIARRLGMDVAGLVPAERNVEGVVEMMLDATQNYAEPLDEERLFAWHASLFPTGRSGMSKIIVGGWRDDAEGPMQVVSGTYGRERVHYQAPAAAQLPDEMAAFLSWFESDKAVDPVLAAGIAHLWFVTVHPFEDATAVSPAPSPILRWRVPKPVRSAFIRCPRRSGPNAIATTICSKQRRRAGSTSRPGSSGFSNASIALSTGPRKLWARCWPRRSSGRRSKISR